jgi:amino acid transporter
MPLFVQPIFVSLKGISTVLWFGYGLLLIFNYRLEELKASRNTSETQAAMYNRDHPRYPYKSHGQWLKAMYGMVACVIILVFNGLGPFFRHPFDTRHFVVDYIAVGLF